MRVIQRTVVIGHDPGFSGGLAAICARERRLLDAIRVPTTGRGTKADPHFVDYDATGYWTDLYGTRACLAVVEMSHGYGGESPERTLRYGTARGEVRAMIGAAGVRHFHEPEPAPWKAAMKVTSDKSTSIALAISLYPNAVNFITGKAGGLHDGVAEAILLAHLGVKMALRFSRG